MPFVCKQLLNFYDIHTFVAKFCRENLRTFSADFFGLKSEVHRHFHFLDVWKSDNLIGIIDFLFCGEANVLQENLDTFLALGLEELKLKGLLDSNEGTTQENIPTYMTEHDELVKSMMEKGPNVISY